MFKVSEKWRKTFPGADVGVLVINSVSNPKANTALNNQKTELEEHLHSAFYSYTKESLRDISTIKVYTEYYRHFKKTYHVLLQLESVVLKGKSIPNVAALVKAMFMAELKNMLLTAGHDLDAVQKPLTIDVSSGTEKYTLLNGKDQLLKAGDMIMTDEQGVISSVIYGPDKRTQIRADTNHALFVVYAPQGISQQAVHQHLKDIQTYIMLFSPQAIVQSLEILSAS
ncbi:hypothetical protein ES705_50416 [subsurface metagenome]